MNDDAENAENDPKQTYTAREIVLELFPATHERLIPKPRRFALERSSDGTVRIRNAAGAVELHLTPVHTAGNHTTQLCCDLCDHSSNRQYMQLVRTEVPGSDGRRFRYLTVCRNTEACESRRFGDEPVEALLRRSR